MHGSSGSSTPRSQQANWVTTVTVGDSVMAEYVAPDLPKTPPAAALPAA